MQSHCLWIPAQSWPEGIVEYDGFSKKSAGDFQGINSICGINSMQS